MKAKGRVSIAMGRQVEEMGQGGFRSIPLLGIFGIMECGGIGRRGKFFGSSSMVLLGPE